MKQFKQPTEAEKLKLYPKIYNRLRKVNNRVICAVLADYIIEHSPFDIEGLLIEIEAINAEDYKLN